MILGRTRTPDPYSGNLWTGQAILRLLRNPVYLGKSRHDNTTHDGRHDAILDADVFQQAQQLLDEQAAEAVDRAAASNYLQRKKLPALRDALAGRFSPHHALIVGEILARLDYLDEAIGRLSTEIDRPEFRSSRAQGVSVHR